MVQVAQVVQGKMGKMTKIAPPFPPQVVQVVLGANLAPRQRIKIARSAYKLGQISALVSRYIV